MKKENSNKTNEMANTESEQLLKRNWPSLSTLKSFFEKEEIEIVFFDGMYLETRLYRYSLVSPQLYMEKL